LILPDYQPQHNSIRIDSIPHGLMMDTLIRSSSLGELHKLTIYLHPGYETSTEKYPVIMFHDGIQFSDITAEPNIMDNLIYERKITPMIAVFVGPVLRDDEYSCDCRMNTTILLLNSLLLFWKQNTGHKKDMKTGDPQVFQTEEILPLFLL
jgi:enterochelin esterase-like enzyme